MNKENTKENSAKREELLVEFLEKRCRVCSFRAIRRLFTHK
jgi:hypothetical protein